MTYLYWDAKTKPKLVSQKTKLMLRVIAVIVVLLTLGMHLQFVLIPALGTYKFWLVVGAFALLLITGQ